MRDIQERRAIELGEHIAKSGATVRAAAKTFGVSKSTVHKDVAVRLWEIDKKLAARCEKVLNKNKSERHIRGGEATRKKYRQRVR